MIEAYFDSSMGRKGLITGAYQYDTGQRLKLSGLPSPDELAEMDDFLSGDAKTVAVQVQYSYQGDTQTEMRLAEWDDDHAVWVVAIPDTYLRRHESVNVYVYVSYGIDDNGSRNKTMYTGVYTPISRPAPGDVASDDQLRSWDDLEAEVDLVLADALTSIEKVGGVAEELNEAAVRVTALVDPVNEATQGTQAATAQLKELDAAWRGIGLQMISLPAGSQATATLEGAMFTLGAPRGEDGDTGPAGEDGPSDMRLSFNSGTGALTITT